MMEEVRPKEFDPLVLELGKQPDCWYRFIPENYPGFCLETQRALVWYDPQMHLGNWRGRCVSAPHRVLMEARDSLFVVHRRYVWDGMSWGVTEPRDLVPTLLHDALYHALQGGAPFPRREADRAYLRAQRLVGAPDGYGQYLTVRWFGGIFNRTEEDKPTIIIELMAPEQPMTPIE